MKEEIYSQCLDWRGIDPATCCRKCGGVGIVTYASGATWHHGVVGGSVMTRGVCDTCWGSGDLARKGVDLRKLEGKIRALDMAVTTIRPDDLVLLADYLDMVDHSRAFTGTPTVQYDLRTLARRLRFLGK